MTGNNNSIINSILIFRFIKNNNILGTSVEDGKFNNPADYNSGQILALLSVDDGDTNYG